MCLALPGKVLTVSGHDGLHMATVDFGGARRVICLEYTPEAEVGSFVIVHAGFAIAMLDEASAAETTALLTEALRPLGELRS